MMCGEQGGGERRVLTGTSCACVCVVVGVDDTDIAELDGGQAATVTFPEVNDLTHFDVKVRRV